MKVPLRNSVFKTTKEFHEGTNIYAEHTMNHTYILAPGTQVREEEFGLLFYSMLGPRLHFISLGNMLDSRFFIGKLTIEQWLAERDPGNTITDEQRSGLTKVLSQLRDKGVIIER
jgi:putative mycofactocin binding protein MftB